MKLVLSAAVLAAITGGCQGLAPAGAPAASAPAAATDSSGGVGVVRADVTDIRPLATSSAQPAGLVMSPMYDSPFQPVTADPIAPAILVAPAFSTPRATSAMLIASAGTHTVRAGETLFSIARSTYGSGKQWRKIALANPGLSPGSLRVGQTIMIP